MSKAKDANVTYAICPACEQGRLRVVDTRAGEKIPGTESLTAFAVTARRKRRCDACGHIEYTLEINEWELKHYVDVSRNLSRRLREMIELGSEMWEAIKNESL